MIVHITVYGNPAPQGSKKFLGRTATGRGIIGDASDKTKPWRADVKAACEAWIGRQPTWQPLNAALLVSMVFTFLRPATVRRSKRPFPSVFPDLSKLARSTEDALSASGLWADDALVVEYGRLAKVYAAEDPEALNTPGVRITVQPKIVEPVPLTGFSWWEKPKEIEAA